MHYWTDVAYRTFQSPSRYVSRPVFHLGAQTVLYIPVIRKRGIDMIPFRKILLVFTVLALVACCTPAGAVLQQFTYRGTVTELDPDSGTLSMKATHEWGCTYGEEEVACGWMAITPVEIEGSVPSNAVFSVVANGTEVEVASVGEPGVTWAGIGALVPTPGIENWYATDLFGDPSMLPAPLADGYGVAVQTLPDCEACNGTICTAKSSEIVISRNGSVVWEKTLAPGEKSAYTDPADNSALSVNFVSGEASAHLCPVAGPMAGPQPISVFVIQVQPACVTGGATLPPHETTTSAGLWPASALLALAVLALVMSLRRREK